MTRTIIVFLCLASPVIGQEWRSMPTKTRQEWKAREEARKAWAKEMRVTRAMVEAHMRKQRIAQKKQSGLYDLYHGLGQLRARYGWMSQRGRACQSRRCYTQ